MGLTLRYRPWANRNNHVLPGWSWGWVLYKIHQCIMLCWYMMDFDPLSGSYLVSFAYLFQGWILIKRGSLKIHQCIMLCWYMMDFDPFSMSLTCFLIGFIFKVHQCIMWCKYMMNFWPFINWTFQRLLYLLEWRHFGGKFPYLPSGVGILPPILPLFWMGKLELPASVSRGIGRRIPPTRSGQAPWCRRWRSPGWAPARPLDQDCRCAKDWPAALRHPGCQGSQAEHVAAFQGLHRAHNLDCS